VLWCIAGSSAVEPSDHLAIVPLQVVEHVRQVQYQIWSESNTENIELRRAYSLALRLPPSSPAPPPPSLPAPPPPSSPAPPPPSSPAPPPPSSPAPRRPTAHHHHQPPPPTSR
jgi:hypothetical protein